MYVDWVEVNGHRFEGEEALSNSASTKTSATEALMERNGTLAFDTHGSAPGATPTPTPTPVITDPAAHATPDIARGYVATDRSGTAHGTAKADDIFASGNGQTLIGGGGDDIFHIGTHTGLTIQVPDAGTTTIATWLGTYTLANGVDNLTLEGNYAHNVIGNALANTIVGADGNDVIDGGTGGDMIIAGSGANKLTGGSGQDLFVFRSGAAHDNVVTDFHLGEDMLDLKAVVAASGYKGTDAIADHVLTIAQAGAEAVVSIDPDGSGAQAAHNVVTLQNVTASSLHAGHDFLWH
jgi:Ca2+-binding RTX toxin-like protein